MTNLVPPSIAKFQSTVIDQQRNRVYLYLYYFFSCKKYDLPKGMGNELKIFFLRVLSLTSSGCYGESKIKKPSEYINMYLTNIVLSIKSL